MSSEWPEDSELDRRMDERPAAPREPERRIQRPEPAYGYEGAGEETASWVPDLRHYLGVLSKRRWAAILAFVLVMTYVAFGNYTAASTVRSAQERPDS